MNYSEALSFVHSRQRFGSRPGLDSMRRITELCGRPQLGMRFLHIAGTNGKGSVSTMLSNILISAGYKTGLYISPYVINFRERIQIDGNMIPSADFARLITRLKPLVLQMDDEGFTVTEFELITCAAFLYFKEYGCDYAVLEVGMGGRLDATNIIDRPEVSVITRIDMDHTAILGDTAEKIAFEKCGIIKNDGVCVMYPDQYDGVKRTVSDCCRERGCKLIVPRIDFASNDRGIDGSTIVYRGTPINLPLIGGHQLLNAATAAEAASAIGIPCEHIAASIAVTSFPARMEVISRSPVVLLDGAHNPNGAHALASTLDVLFGGEKAVAVMGMLADKDVKKALCELSPRFSDIITLTVPNPRTLSAAALKNAVQSCCDVPVRAARSYISAIRQADALADGRPVVVCGSLYLAAAIRPKLIEYYQNGQ